MNVLEVYLIFLFVAMMLCLIVTLIEIKIEKKELNLDKIILKESIIGSNFIFKDADFQYYCMGNIASKPFTNNYRIFYNYFTHKFYYGQHLLSLISMELKEARSIHKRFSKFKNFT